MGDLLKGVPDEWGPKYEGDAGAATGTGSNEIGFVAPTHMALVVCSSQPDRNTAFNCDQQQPDLAPVGVIEIFPSGTELFAKWSVAKEGLLVAVSPQRLQRLAVLETETDNFELRPPKRGHVDDKALAIARLIRAELLRGEHRNEDYLDSLITIFATYLLRHYSSFEDRQTDVPPARLAPHVMRRINNFIEANLGEKISVEHMAQIAELSPSHFLRAFRNSTRMPPHRYLLAARLAHAKHLAVTTDTPLQDIAKSAGFHSNSHLTATMQRMWSIKPSDLRKHR